MLPTQPLSRWLRSPGESASPFQSQNARLHGDPFPLPDLPNQLGRDAGLTSTQQRLASQGIASLNKLAAVLPFSNAFSTRIRRCTAVQSVVLSSVADRVARLGGCPSDLDERTALAECLRHCDLYSQEPKALAPFDLDRLAVSKGRLQPRPVLDHLPSHPRGLLRHFQHFIERPPDELATQAATLDPIRPYWDPTLAASKQTRWEFLRRLYELRLGTFRCSAKAFVGLFFVW